jgi:hypothetical protein
MSTSLTLPLCPSITSSSVHYTSPPPISLPLFFSFSNYLSLSFPPSLLPSFIPSFLSPYSLPPFHHPYLHPLLPPPPPPPNPLNTPIPSSHWHHLLVATFYFKPPPYYHSSPSTEHSHLSISFPYVGSDRFVIAQWLQHSGHRTHGSIPMVFWSPDMTLWQHFRLNCVSYTSLCTYNTSFMPQSSLQTLIRIIYKWVYLYPTPDFLTHGP